MNGLRFQDVVHNLIYGQGLFADQVKDQKCRIRKFRIGHDIQVLE
jgi:hypothetical protein